AQSPFSPPPGFVFFTERAQPSRRTSRPPKRPRRPSTRAAAPKTRRPRRRIEAPHTPPNKPGADEWATAPTSTSIKKARRPCPPRGRRSQRLGRAPAPDRRRITRERRRHDPCSKRARRSKWSLLPQTTLSPFTSPTPS